MSARTGHHLHEMLSNDEDSGAPSDSFDVTSGLSHGSNGTSLAVQPKLARMIEGEIIPRLMLAHGAIADPPQPARPRPYAPGPQDVEAFAQLVMQHETAEAREHVSELTRQGVSLEIVFLNLFAPAARLLGDYWRADLVTFADVTIALSRLQQLLREFAPLFRHSIGNAAFGYRALLTPVPGEQHTFGLFMVEEFFRHGGWDIAAAPLGGEAELAGTIEDQPYAMVGFSVSCGGLLDGVSSAIRTVRATSRNRSVVVMVGGRVFVEQPELARKVGADCTAFDARKALEKANHLIGSRLEERR